MSRATPMSPDQRRRAIIDATLPLLLEKGSQLSTREIARAAGVAEGTIFRAFETKSDIIHAAIHAALEPTETLAKLAELDPTQTLEARVEAILEILLAELARTRALFVHLTGAGLGPHRSPHPGGPHRPGPPGSGPGDGRLRTFAATTEALSPYADHLRVPVVTAAKLLNALAFAASFTTSDEDAPPTAISMASTVLYGIAQGEK